MENKKSLPQRPLGITIIAVYFAIEGLFFFSSNSVGIFGNQDISILFGESAEANLDVVIGFVAALSRFAISASLFGSKSWARKFTMIVLAVTLTSMWIGFALSQIHLFGVAISTVVFTIILVYLQTSKVMKYFVQLSEISSKS